MIQFDQIPGSIMKPGVYVEFNTLTAVRGLPGNKQKILIIGQKTSAGTASAKVPAQAFSDEEAEALFGPGSLCHQMLWAALKANPYAGITVIPLADDANGAKATGAFTLNGTASASGTITFYIAGQALIVGVAKGDTATVIASAAAAAAAKTHDLPVTVASSEGVVTLTARNKGTVGNQITQGVQITGTAGVTSSTTSMSGGATDPDIQDALTVALAGGYDIIVTPYNTQTPLASLRDHLDAVSGPLEQRPAIGVYAVKNTLSDATTLAGQLNSGRLVGAFARYSNTTRRNPPYEIASAVAAVMASEDDPARPLNGMNLNGIYPYSVADRLLRSEQESCMNNGVTPLEVGPGELVRIVRAVSTYTVDGNGIADPSLLDITTIRTLDYVRKAVRERIALRFPREKLSAKTPQRVRAEIIDVLLKLEEAEIVENVADNLDGVTVERNASDANRLDAKIPTDVVNGLHVVAGRIDLIL
ncbi:MAG: phage tail sheath subtilisin-like domain-containing protein [Deltaproteobacteria bacterium]|nr:phage tail sheath subtilisin-like domain-containing protein [Deltaproteobacteria bacterium]